MLTWIIVKNLSKSEQTKTRHPKVEKEKRVIRLQTQKLNAHNEGREGRSAQRRQDERQKNDRHA